MRGTEHSQAVTALIKPLPRMLQLFGGNRD